MKLLFLLMLGATWTLEAADSDAAFTVVEGELNSQQLSAPPQPLDQSDERFIEAMYDAPVLFIGRLFTGYRQQCLGERCAYEGVVFKVIDSYSGDLSSYEEGDWIADENNLWLYPADWQNDPLVELFEIDREYLVIGFKDERGLHVTGVRPAGKIKQLVMRFELESIGRR